MTPSDDYLRSRSALHRNWGWMLLRGVLALVLGVIAILFPLNAILAFTLIFAAFAAADGILSLIAGLRGAAHHADRWGTMVVRGIVGIAVATFFLVAPEMATLGYALVTVGVLVAWALITGTLEIVAAIRLRREIKGEWLLGLSGVLSVLLGLFVWSVLWTSPLASLLTVAWIIALWAFVAGIALVTLALKLRRLQQRAIPR